jgi:hypothetical protein
MGAALSFDLGKVKELVVLDPAFGTYKISENSESFKTFKNKAQNTKCFVGTSSILGSEELTETCDEKIFIDFPTKNIINEHSGVHKIYRDILKNNTLYKNILSPKNKTKISKGDININGNHIWQDSELDYLKVEENGKEIFYGSEIDNEFICEESICEFGGWLGDDSYKMNEDSGDFTIKDFTEKRKISSK